MPGMYGTRLRSVIVDFVVLGAGVRRGLLQTPVLRTLCYEGQAAGTRQTSVKRWVCFSRIVENCSPANYGPVMGRAETGC